MQSRREQIAARAGSPKYIEWVWTTNFNTWLQGPDSFYWITGCPGSGKSTLMKHISESRRTLDALQVNGKRWTTIHFFFDFRAKVGGANTIEGMLRSLLYQVAKRLPDVAKHLESTLLLETLPEIGLHDYMDNLCDSIQQTSTKLCVFIGGLDEFAGSESDLLDPIYSLEDRSSLKICMASRPYPIFKDNLSGYQQLVMQEHNHQTIQLYTEAKFKSNRIVGAASLPRQLANKILEKARGVILWARLATDELLRDLLAGKSVAELEIHLNQMPQEVQEMYQRILDRLPEVLKLEAALLLYILTASEGEIEVRKLFIAMWSVHLKISTSDTIQPVDEGSDNYNDSRLVALLGDLVDITASPRIFSTDLFFFGKARVRMRQAAAPTSFARLTHKTLYTYLTNNEWLKKVLGPYFKTSDKSRFWFDLFLDEILDCLGGCEALPAMAVQRYQSFMRELAKTHEEIRQIGFGPSGNELIRDSSRLHDVIELLELWKGWTPLLPYALQEIFPKQQAIVPQDTHQLSCLYEERIDDLRRILHSPISWVHKLMCVFQGAWAYHSETCSRQTAGLNTNGYVDGQIFSDLRISIPLCHDMPAELMRVFCNNPSSILPATKQMVFDYACAYDRYLEREEWRDLLVMLLRTGTRLQGSYLCNMMFSSSFSIHWSFLIDSLKYDQIVLSEHRFGCKYSRGLTPEVDFLCHWAELYTTRENSADEDLTTLFEALSICHKHVNQIADPAEEPLLNVILQKKYRYAAILKTILALQAGADFLRSGLLWDSV